MKAAQDRQTSNADLKRRLEGFEVGDRVLLRVSLMSGMVRFGARGKSSPRFTGTYEISDRNVCERWLTCYLFPIRWQNWSGILSLHLML